MSQLRMDRYEEFIKKPNRLWMVVRIIISVACFLLVFLIGVILDDSGRHTQVFKSTAFLASCGLGVAAALAFATGLRSLSGLGAWTVSHSSGDPVLFLRSFTNDSKWLGDLGAFRSLISLFTFWGIAFNTYESLLSFAVRGIGPLVAIGSPKDFLPALGAKRVYVTTDWKEVVAELVTKSKVVFLRPGETEGLQWEVEYLLTNCEPTKLFICFPKHNCDADYSAFREVWGSKLPTNLPASLEGALFVTFDSHWSPQLLRPNVASVTRRIVRFARSLIVSYGPHLYDALPARLKCDGAAAQLPRMAWPEYVFWGTWSFLVLCVLILVLLAGISAGPYIYTLF